MQDITYYWGEGLLVQQDLAPTLGVDGEQIKPDVGSIDDGGSAFIGVESITGTLEVQTPEANVLIQGRGDVENVPYFNPINITRENGIYYVTLYVCCVDNDSMLAQRLAIWLGSLKETDHIKLSVAATLTNIPFAALVTVMGALANTKAKIEILLDQIVIDGLAYFYLLADKVTALECGGLFVPSYVDQRREDTSVPWKAVHDFYEWIVSDAIVYGRLTEEEAERLNAGAPVVIPTERFAS